MTQASPQIGPLGSPFEVPAHPQRSLAELVEDAGLDRVHFFIDEAISSRAIEEDDAKGDTICLALLPYDHPTDALDDALFEHLENASLQPATLRDLVCFAIAHPEAGLEHEIVATGTMRTRHVYGAQKPGETTWKHTTRDKTICQWVTGLSRTGHQRELVPMEIYLKDLLRQPARVLVRVS
ncbi:hypothetical protein [Lujinxingia litoralis]|nr:hypothetical protein [Lujinxingia litoralis]